MKKLIWKLRYAFYLWRRSTGTPFFKFCFKSATIQCNENMEPDEWRTESPEYMAQEELYCWAADS